MSFLPGLGLAAPPTSSGSGGAQLGTASTAISASAAAAASSAVPAEPRRVDLPPASEWRFEVPTDGAITVRLLPNAPAHLFQPANNGQQTRPPTAELFGTELAPNHAYSFSFGAKAAIYTHHGCSLEVVGACDSEYVAEETPMAEYTNLHFALENMRNAASADNGGPRVLVLGPSDAGKTSLLKLLATYATRSGRSPLVCSLDPRDAPLSLPGTISATVLGAGSLLDIEDSASGGWGSSPITGPSAIPVKAPLVYHCGIEKAEEHPDIFKPVATRLALAATSRFEEDAAVKQAGMLLELGGSVVSGARATRQGYDVVQHVVSEFSVNVILVLGSERLYSDMSRRFANSSATDEQVHVLKLPKSGGCVDRDAAYLKHMREQRVRAYFFGGAPRSTLSPHAQLVDFDALQVLRPLAGGSADGADASQTNANFLPGGSIDDDLPAGSSSSTRETQDKLFDAVRPTVAMSRALLAIKHAAALHDAAATVRDASVLGFLWVADVDEAKRRLKLLSPVGGRLPVERAVVWGHWPELSGDLLG